MILILIQEFVYHLKTILKGFLLQHGDEKLNLISVPGGFGYPHPRPRFE